MKIENLTEREDGSATAVLVDMTPEEINYLLQEGFLVMLKRYLEQHEKDMSIPALCKEKGK